MHPVNRNGVIVYDLRSDPDPLLTMSAEEIRTRLYTATADLPEGTERIPLKVVHLNRAPVVVPMGTITDAAREQWHMDAQSEQRHLEALRSAPGLAGKLAEVFGAREQFPPQSDPDRDLYGGFLSDADRRRCAKLDELLFRYRARNWPESLQREERLRWEEFRHERLTQAGAGATLVLDDYRKQLSRLAVDATLSPHQRAVVDALIEWPLELGL
jgi:exodeoxyribonuclease-1